MTRLLLLAAAALSLAGCRSSCGSNHCSLFNRSACPPKATPMSYGAPATTYPASISSGFTAPIGATTVSGIPMIPPPSANAAELPFPTEAIPPAGLPVSGAAPSGARSVGLPK